MIKNTKTGSKAGNKAGSQAGSKSNCQQEQFKVYGHEALEKIKALIKEGNIRRIIIKNEKGKVMMEIPMTFAVVGTVFAPVLAAIGALAALMNKCTIEVERK